MLEFSMATFPASYHCGTFRIPIFVNTYVQTFEHRDDPCPLLYAGNQDSSGAHHCETPVDDFSVGHPLQCFRVRTQSERIEAVIAGQTSV